MGLVFTQSLFPFPSSPLLLASLSPLPPLNSCLNGQPIIMIFYFSFWERLMGAGFPFLFMFWKVYLLEWQLLLLRYSWVTFCHCSCLLPLYFEVTTSPADNLISSVWRHEELFLYFWTSVYRQDGPQGWAVLVEVLWHAMCSLIQQIYFYFRDILLSSFNLMGLILQDTIFHHTRSLLSSPHYLPPFY